jgi:hypothetical protein
MARTHLRYMFDGTLAQFGGRVLVLLRDQMGPIRLWAIRIGLMRLPA